MRKILYTIVLVGVMLGFSLQAFGVKAHPKPIVYTQPDGTQVTITLHGDEFLHWATVGNKLVTTGEDGYVYLASFDAEGKVVRSNTKIGNSPSFVSSSFSSSVTPPPIAIQKALQKRNQFFNQINSNYAYGSGKSLSKADKSVMTTGEKRFLILLVEFKDVHFSIDGPNVAFSNMLNQRGYSANEAAGSVRDYYEENSRGAFQPIFDVKGPIRVSQNASYYGGNDSRGDDQHPDEMVAEACRLLDSSDPSVNFADYDLDGDGYVDNVFVYYAGHNEAEGGAANTIWPHSWVLYYYTVNLDGVRVFSYACTSEYSGSSGSNMCGIGTFCHEYGHVLGLPDFYDIDYSTNGAGAGLDCFSLMSSGNYNGDGKIPPYLNAEERKLLGWMGDPTEITASRNVAAKSIDNNEAYFIETPNEGEYFLFEARKKSGWDNSPEVKPGLLIYHVDKSNNMVSGSTAKKRWEDWDINSIAAHQCMDLVETVPEADIEYYAELIFPGRSAAHPDFTPTTSPAFLSWAGESTGFSITGITVAPDGANFTATFAGSSSIEGRVVNSLNEPLAGIAVTVKVGPSETQTTYNLTSDENGYFSVPSVTKDTRYTISCSPVGYIEYNSGDLYTSEGITSPIVRLFTPSEYIVSRGINMINSLESSYPSGTEFTLAVLLSGEVPVSINWTYDGAPKNNGDTVTLTAGDHDVVATLVFSDGRVETIEKTIVVSE